MKWVIIFLLVSCGKHEIPPRQYLNLATENVSDPAPIIGSKSNIELKIHTKEVPSLKGKVIISSSDIRDEAIELDVVNGLSLGRIQKFIGADKSSINNADLLEEWSRFKFSDTSKVKIFGDKKYSLKFIFPNTKSKGYHLSFIKKGQVYRSILISPAAVLDLTSDELEGLITGKFFLQLSSDIDANHAFLSSTKNLYFQVVYFHGSNIDLFSVPKTLKLDQLLDSLSIKDPKDIDNEDLLISTANDQEKWWMRSLGNGDRILVKTSLQNLKSWHLSNYKKYTSTLLRENGFSKNEFTIHKNFHSKLMLKLRFTKTIHEFRTQNFRHSLENNICLSSCNCKLTDTHNVRPEVVSLEEGLDNIDIFLDAQKINTLDKKVFYSFKSDHLGPYLEVYISSPSNVFTLKLPSKPEDSYTAIGVTTKCPFSAISIPSQKPTLVHPEVSFSLNIEALVENLDEIN